MKLLHIHYFNIEYDNDIINIEDLFYYKKFIDELMKNNLSNVDIELLEDALVLYEKIDYKLEKIFKKNGIYFF